MQPAAKVKASCKDGEVKFFLIVPDNIIRDNDLKLLLGSFRLDTLPGGQWNQKEVAQGDGETSSIEIFKTWLDKFMADML